MVRGISFKVSQKQDNSILWSVLQNIHVEKYKWHNSIEENEVWADTDGNSLFEKSYYEGIDFLKEIQSECYVIFLKLQAYEQDGAFSEIHTYEEFLHGECQILLLIYDTAFVEIYAKDMDVISLVYKDAIKNGYEDIEYITELNDVRTKMDIL